MAQLVAGTCRVLVAGNPEDVHAVRALLPPGERYESCEVIEAALALDAVRAGQVDVVMVDLSMTVNEGRSLWQEIRRLRPEMAVVVLAAREELPKAQEAVKQGALRYLVKPFQEGELAQTLDDALHPHQPSYELARLRDLEQRLRQSQKLEIVGRLTGALAHDLNNQMTVMLGFSEIILESPGIGGALKESLLEIRKAAERASSLSRQLLTFSQRQEAAILPVDLNGLIGGMENMFRRLIGEDVELLTILQPALALVKADRSQMEQVLMNLLLNSRDAMPRGGRLTIQTGNVVVGDAEAREIKIAPGAYVVLRVGDTGIGMDEQIQSRAFEPFFTTKSPQQGTGLGLTIVKDAIQPHGGCVHLSSKPGEGTTVSIYLPQESASGEPVNPAAASPQESPRGSETVLVVEDHEGVRTVIREALRRNGYNVLNAPDSRRALFLSKLHEGAIHLLVTDVVMPQMDGPELAEKLTASRPSMKILYMSGRSDEVLAEHGVAEATTPFLQKPFTADVLTRKVRQVLDS